MLLEFPSVLLDNYSYFGGITRILNDSFLQMMAILIGIAVVIVVIIVGRRKYEILTIETVPQYL